MSTISDYVHGLIEPEPIVEDDLAHLSFSELEGLMKTAMVSCAPMPEGRNYASWLDQFIGTPLHAKALQICEAELGIERERLERNLQRQAESQAESDTWTRQDMLRLEKDMLQLELHKSMAGQGGGKDPVMQAQAAAVESEAPHGEQPGVAVEAEPAPAPKAKKASDVQTVGQVNNGDPRPPQWDPAALGVESAGRRATPEELKQQNDTATPQHVKPMTQGGALIEAVKASNAYCLPDGSGFMTGTVGKKEKKEKKAALIEAIRNYPLV